MGGELCSQLLSKLLLNEVGKLQLICSLCAVFG